jgi:gluconate:H+ symporter, GntP family
MLFIGVLLIASIAAIVLLSARWQFNAFFVLLLVSAATGMVAGIEGAKIIQLLKVGLGGTIEKIGLLIVLGTTLGMLLEKSGATTSLANAVLGITGQTNAPLGLSLIGFVIGLPIFCDSGFIVLSGLAVSLAARAPDRRTWLVVCLATALYAVHCLVPPHPGVTAAAGILNVDIGLTMLIGVVVAIPPAVVGYFWGKWANNRRQTQVINNNIETGSSLPLDTELPPPFWAMLPIVVPVLMIAAKSVVLLNPANSSAAWFGWVSVLGDPLCALLAGILLCFPLLKGIGRSQFNQLLDAALSKAGGILLVTAAGGAFGEIIKALDIGTIFGSALTGSGLGLFIPFVLAAIFKSAQGSSTVAVISTAGIVAPLLPALQLDADMARVCTLLAMGAGSMAVSHSNDSYFWVVSRFGQLDTNTTLKAYTPATVLMAIAGFLSIWVVFKMF